MALPHAGCNRGVRIRNGRGPSGPSETRPEVQIAPPRPSGGIELFESSRSESGGRARIVVPHERSIAIFIAGEHRPFAHLA